MRHLPMAMRHLPMAMRHIPIATFTHRRHLPIASIRYDAWSIRYLIVVAYGYLSRENRDLIEAMGKCRLWVNVSSLWVNVPWVMGKCRHGYMSHGYMSPNRSVLPIDFFYLLSSRLETQFLLHWAEPWVWASDRRWLLPRRLRWHQDLSPMWSQLNLHYLHFIKSRPCCWIKHLYADQGLLSTPKYGHCI